MKDFKAFWPTMITAFALLAGCTSTPAPAEHPDWVQQMAGLWRVQTGDVVEMDCASGQKFEPHDDQRSISLNELGTDFTTTYRVLTNDRRGLQLQILGEKRQTEDGDPVKWWVEFDGPNEFRWRRDDWSANSATAARWIRCN